MRHLHRRGVRQITQNWAVSKRPLRQSGNAILPGFTAPKILWLKRNEPKNFAKLATVLLPHDYLNFWLTGNRVMEFGDASGTALLDVKKTAVVASRSAARLTPESGADACRR